MGRIRLEGVGRTYPENPPVVALAGVELTIEQGEFVALVGPSGSGKSTMLNLLGLIDGPSTGTYELDGRAVGGRSERERARLRSTTFGFVFQSFHLIARRTALENVEIGLLYRGVPPATRRRLALDALAAVGLAHRASLPTDKLSGGERQRVAIARATLGHAPVLLADEPTGNLDSVNGQVVVGQLEALAATGVTVVLVTHDPQVAAVAARQVVLRDGRIVSDQVPAVDRGRPRPELAPVPGRPSRMRPADLVREAARAVRVRPGRSSAMVGAVAVAVALVVATFGLSSSASGQVSNQFDIRRNRAVTISSSYASLDAAGQPLRFPPDAEARVDQVAGVVRSAQVEHFDVVSVSVPAAETTQSIELLGVSASFDRIAGTDIRWAFGQPHQLGPHEIVLGGLAAQGLALGPLDQEPTVQIAGETYAVVGLLESSDRLPEMATAALASLADARALLPPASDQMFIDVQPGAAPQVARQAPIALDPVDAARFEVDAPVDPSTLRSAIQADVGSTLLALSGVAALASLLGVANAMLMGVLERIGELGLRRAIGARPVHIVAQIGCESLLLGLLGGAAGLFVGMVAVLGVTIAHHWQPLLDLRLFPIALLGGAVVGVLGGSAASVRASRIHPGDALRR